MSDGTNNVSFIILLPGIGYVLILSLQVGLIFCIYVGLPGRCCVAVCLLYTTVRMRDLVWWRGGGFSQGAGGLRVV